MNERQKAFCRNVAEGMNQTEAYLHAGYKASREQAKKKASALMNREDVQAELARLRQPKEDAAIMSRNERMRHLSTMARAAVESMAVSDAVKAIHELNMMDGVYKDSHKDSPSVNVQVGVKGMLFSDLMKEVERGETTPTPAAC